MRGWWKWLVRALAAGFLAVPLLYLLAGLIGSLIPAIWVGVSRTRASSC